MKLPLILSAAATLVFSSCGSISPSGFLDDYDQLQPSKNAMGAKMAYVNPDMDFAKYDSILFDPLVFILPEDSKVTDQEKARLVEAMRDALSKELRKDYKFVSEPGPTTIRFRGALTELVPANRPVNVVTSIVPASRIVAEGQQLSTGMSAFSARGTGEAEMVDSVTGERLVAIADTRYARKQATTSATRWGEIESAMERAAADLRKGLASLRDR